MKEQTTLPDIQLSRDPRGIGIDSVGVRGVEFPLLLAFSFQPAQTVMAKFELSTSLAKELRATHMSRFIGLLNEFTSKPLKGITLLPLLTSMRESLHSQSAQVKVDFRFFLTKAAPISKISAPMAYSCSIYGFLGEGAQRVSVLSLTLPVANLCPCSKAISDYGAHNQRAELRAKLVLKDAEDYHVDWLGELVDLFEAAPSSPVYPLLKRVDEKCVTEQQYDNPKFVEDMVRDAACLVREHHSVSGFSLEVEAFESIHAHNAWASYSENFPSNLTNC